MSSIQFNVTHIGVMEGLVILTSMAYLYGSEDDVRAYF